MDEKMKKIRSEARKIEPIMRIGKNGITENVVNEEDESEEDNTSSSQSTQTKNSDKKVLYPVTDLHITAPNTVHVNEQVEFIAEPIDGRKNRLVRYFWNFGDGATADTASPTHSYKYPGNVAARKNEQLCQKIWKILLYIL